MTELQRAILVYLRVDGPSSMADIHGATLSSKKLVAASVKDLAKTGMIVRKGTGAATAWWLTPDGRIEANRLMESDAVTAQ